MRGLGEVYKRTDGRSPFWWIKYYDANGKRRRESTSTMDKKMAEQILKRRLLEFDSLRNGLKTESDMPYEVFSEQFLRHYKARYGYETVKSHTSIVNEFKRFLNLIGASLLSEITSAIINKYITYLREAKKNRANTCNNHLKNLHTQFTFAINNGLLTKNPAKGCPKVEVNDAKPKGALSVEDIQRFLKIARKRYPFYYPIYCTFLSTGLRFTELINLKWVDLDFEGKILRVMKPKGKKKSDYISMPDDLVGLLKSLPRKNEYVFTSEKGAPFSYRTRKLIRRLKKIVEEAEIKSISTIHELRHTYCSQLFSIGFSTREAQKAMRHTDLNITEGYAHIFMPEYNKKIKRLDKIVKIGT